MTNRKTTNPLTAWLAALLAVACLLLAADSARAATDLIVNGDMAAGKTGWTPVLDPSVLWGTWDEVGTPPVDEQNMLTNGIWDGTDVYKIGFSGGTVTNEGAHVYQEFGAAPGALYTLACDAGVQDWWLPWGQIELIFFNAGNNVVGSNVVRFTDSLHDDFNGTTNLYDALGGVPMLRVTNSAVAPFGTTKVRAQLSNVHGTVLPSGGGNPGSGGNAFFDNVSLISPVVPPTIANVSPDGSMLLNATNTFSFTASSAAGVTDIVVALNGVDVSGDLSITGPDTSRAVAYTNLQPGTIYTAEISVTDADSLVSAVTVTFDTFTPTFTWEGEDYNYGVGSYINNPTPSDSANPGVSYFGETGVEGIDFHDYSANGNTDYRAGDAMATEGTGDGTRQKFLDASASDYNVGWFDGRTFGPFPDGIDGFDAGEWVNYTRDFPAGTYNIYGRLANGNGGTASIPLSRVTSDPTFPDQTTTELGVFSFPALGWGNYVYAPLTDELGNFVEVTFSGKDTLRVTAGSGGNLNFFMLVPVDTTQPTITGVYPDGRTLLQGTNELVFTASSGSSSIAQSNVVVTLNGADISGSLSFSGSSSSWDVSGPLELGVTNYIAVLSVTDDAGNSHSVTVYFDTFDPASYVVEGEDYNYQGGLFIDNPVITSVNADDSYFDSPFDGTRIETEGVDVYLGDNPPGLTEGVWRYRALGGIRTDVSTDTPMQKLLDAQAINELAFGYHAGYLRSNSWMNYTRTYPAGEFNVYARVSSGLAAYTLPFESVNGGTTLLGKFEGSGRGFDFFDWIPLVDTNGGLAKVTLGGEATLRINTPEGEVNVNSFLFVPAVTLPEELQWSYAGGTLTLTWDDPAFRLQSQTNAPGAGISAGWSDYPGGGTSPVDVTVDPLEGSVFYRLTD